MCLFLGTWTSDDLGVIGEEQKGSEEIIKHFDYTGSVLPTIAITIAVLELVSFKELGSFSTILNICWAQN